MRLLTGMPVYDTQPFLGEDRLKNIWRAFRNRMQVVYIPYPVRFGRMNEYVLNMVRILRRKYTVRGTLADPFDIPALMDTEAVFLNWVENSLEKDMKLRIRLHRLFGAKIVWVFHNRIPHDAGGDADAEENLVWLADQSDVILLHSKRSREYIPGGDRNRRKAVYIPHVAYRACSGCADLESTRQRYGISERNFVFTMFGLIRPYKNIERTIEAFRNLGLPGSKLLIAGSPSDSRYAKQIEGMGAGSPDILFDLRYIEGGQLDGIIGISDVIVLPYHGRSSMNSGAMIKAFSNGKPVIAPDFCMARDFARKGFFYGYRGSLEGAMERAYRNGKDVSREMGERARCHMLREHSEEAVSARLYALLGFGRKRMDWDAWHRKVRRRGNETRDRSAHLGGGRSSRGSGNSRGGVGQKEP